MKLKLIIAFLFAVFSAEQLSAQSSGNAFTRPGEKSIQLSTGVNLEYAEQGSVSGVPVIFLHGLSDSWHSFETVFRFLPGSIRAFAISQRGHGDSEKPVQGYHPKNFAADVAAFIKQKKLGKAIVVGHSMGGVHAQQFVLDYPHLSLGMVIIDSDADWNKNPGMNAFLEEVMTLENTIDRKFMEAFQSSTISRPIDSNYYRLIVNEGLKVPLRVFQSVLSEMLEVDYVNQLHLINVPALMFWGDKDEFCHLSDQHQLKNGIRNSGLIIYEGTGHALHWEQPQRFANDLVQFLNTITINK